MTYTSLTKHFFGYKYLHSIYDKCHEIGFYLSKNFIIRKQKHGLCTLGQNG